MRKINAHQNTIIIIGCICIALAIAIILILTPRRTQYAQANLPLAHGQAPQTAPISVYSGGMIDFDFYNILRVHDQSLFLSSGEVNQPVLDSLLAVINSPELDPRLRAPKIQWSTGLAYTDTPHTAVTAYDFSNFVVQNPVCMSVSGAIAIKLFEYIPDMYGVEHGHISEFTSQWWQLVYRATCDSDDVLTLWMMQPYRTTPFGGTRYDTLLGRRDEQYVCRTGEFVWRSFRANMRNTILSDHCIVNNLRPSPYFFFENNYSESIMRANLLRDMEHVFAEFYALPYLVSPKHLPGNWQSSRFQTGSNTERVFYATGEFQQYLTSFPGSTHPNGGLGAAGLIWGRHHHFNMINGKDGLSIGPFYNHWPNTINQPTYYDLLWIASDFETRSMGHNKDLATFQTFLRFPYDRTTDLRWNYTNRETDWRTDTTHGRSGLWRLNGFDRAFCAAKLGLPSGWEANLIWMRSTESRGMGLANTICNAGNRYIHGIHQRAGMRPGVHVSVAMLEDRIHKYPH